MSVTVPCRTIAHEAAHRAVAAAVAHGLMLGKPVNAAVVDRGGNLVAFLRAEGAPLHSAEIAIDKAYTAVSFGFPTGEWPRVLDDLSPGARVGLPAVRRLTPFAGGLPILVNGERIGAIGVSGASEEEDESCARAGLRVIVGGDEEAV